MMMRYGNDNAKHRKGVTLVEMVLAISMMTIILGGILPLFAGVRKNWATRQANAEITQNARVLVDHLQHHLRQAVRIVEVSAPSQTDGYLTFTASDGLDYRYALGGGYVQYGPSGELADLAGPVSRLQFNCYDGDDFSAPVTDASAIRFVTVGITFPHPGPRAQDRTFTTGVFLRTDADSSDRAVAVPALAVSDAIDVKGFGQIRAHTGTAAASTNATGNNKIQVKDDGVIDGNVLVGPGGNPDHVVQLQGRGAITGSIGVLDEAVPIPVSSEPSLGPSVGDCQYQGGTTTILADLHCRKLTIKNSAVVQILGDVTILAEHDISVSGAAQITLLPGATLTLYGKKKFTVDGDQAKVNVNTTDASRFTLWLLNHEAIELAGDGQVYGTFRAPLGHLKIKDRAQFFGAYRGDKVTVEDNGQIHLVP